MKFIECPRCLSTNVVPNTKHSKDFAYQCLSCGLLFNTSSNNHYHKAVTLEYRINKSLFFPKLSELIDSSSRCLFEGKPLKNLDCSCLDCDDCIFSKNNYAMYTNYKEEQKGE